MYIPVSYDVKTKSFLAVKREEFLFDYRFSFFYVNKEMTRSIGYQDFIENYMAEPLFSAKPFVTLFHTTRCRSTLLTQDLFFSGVFDVINEPTCFPAENKKIDFIALDQIIRLADPKKYFCHKVSLFYNYFPIQHLEKYKESMNYFLYREPKEILMSNLSQKSKYFNDLNKDSATKEFISQVLSLKNTFERFTPLVAAGKIQPLSFEQIGSFEAIDIIAKDLDFEISKNNWEILKEKRKYNSKAPKVIFEKEVGSDINIQKKYEDVFEIMVRKFKINETWVDFLEAVEKYNSRKDL